MSKNSEMLKTAFSTAMSGQTALVICPSLLQAKAAYRKLYQMGLAAPHFVQWDPINLEVRGHGSGQVRFIALPHADWDLASRVMRSYPGGQPTFVLIDETPGGPDDKG